MLKHLCLMLLFHLSWGSLEAATNANISWRSYILGESSSGENAQEVAHFLKNFAHEMQSTTSRKATMNEIADKETQAALASLLRSCKIEVLSVRGQEKAFSAYDYLSIVQNDNDVYYQAAFWDKTRPKYAVDKFLNAVNTQKQAINQFQSQKIIHPTLLCVEDENRCGFILHGIVLENNNAEEVRNQTVPSTSDINMITAGTVKRGMHVPALTQLLKKALNDEKIPLLTASAFQRLKRMAHRCKTIISVDFHASAEERKPENLFPRLIPGVTGGAVHRLRWFKSHSSDESITTFIHNLNDETRCKALNAYLDKRDATRDIDQGIIFFEDDIRCKVILWNSSQADN